MRLPLLISAGLSLLSPALSFTVPSASSSKALAQREFWPAMTDPDYNGDCSNLATGYCYVGLQKDAIAPIELTWWNNICNILPNQIIPNVNVGDVKVFSSPPAGYSALTVHVNVDPWPTANRVHPIEINYAGSVTKDTDPCDCWTVPGLNNGVYCFCGFPC